MEKDSQATKVLIIFSRYPGNYPLLNSMVFGLIPRGYAFKVCYLRGRPDGGNLLDREGISVYLHGRGHTKAGLRTVFSLAKLIRAEKPLIIHCHRHKSTVYGTIASLLTGGGKVISHVHGLRRTRSLGRRITNSILAARVSRYVAVSECVRNDVVKSNWFIKDSRVTAVRNGLDIALVDAVSTRKEEVRARLGVERDEFLFGTVGRLAPTKGHSFLIDAFQTICEKMPHSRLLIVGEGPLLGTLRRKTETLGLASRVLFPGYRDDVLELLRGLDVFVFPSLAEGLPLALLEAMASRLPVVASAVGGIPEIVGEGSGMLVPSRDTVSLSRAMLEMTLMQEEQRRTMGEEARRRVEKAFTVDAMCEGLQSVYDDVVHA